MKSIVAVVASTLLISGVYAGSTFASSDAPAASDAASSSMMKGDAKRNTALEKHIHDLHKQLKISAAEEPQWADVVQTMRTSAAELDTAIDKRKSMADNATAVDDLNAYGDIAQAHADGVKKLSAVFSKLYGAMPDDQKQLADAVFTHRPHEGKKSD